MSEDLAKAITAAKKKIRTLRLSALESNLQQFCGTYSDAYLQGVVEAQSEIIERLMALQRISYAKEQSLAAKLNSQEQK